MEFAFAIPALFGDGGEKLHVSQLPIAERILEERGELHFFFDLGSNISYFRFRVLCVPIMVRSDPNSQKSAITWHATWRK